MNEHIEEQPYDDRHNTPPNPLLYPTSERTTLTGQDLPTHEEVRAARFTPIMPAPTRTGLIWHIAPGQELQDIGRTFTDTDALDNMHSVDLRTILAHLDSAAQAIKTELDARYGRPSR